MGADAPIIGIDLGTTNSCGAVVEMNKPRVIPSRMGYNTIPSIVGVDGNGDLLIGHSAKRQMLINPKNTVYGSKRLVGRRYSSPIVQEIRRYFTYDLVPLPGDGIGVKLAEQVLTLPQVSSLILKEVREVAQDYLATEVRKAIISVPAFYSERQRAAVKEAGKLAGLEVERIISEPTAAALAYGVQKHKDQRILVYDLGGGTFDASVVEIRSGDFHVVSTGGDTFLGGVDFDNRLLSQLLYEFLDETGVDLAKYPVVVQRLRDACESAKVELSSVPRTEIHVPFVAKVNGNPKDIHRTVTADELRALTMDLVDRTIRVCKEVLAAKGLTAEDLDAILLVGGQSRFPLVHEKIFEAFKKEPSKSIHPDEAVALGTAILGASIAGGGLELKFRDVLPMSLSIGAPGGRCIKVIDRNTVLPFTKRLKISATPDPDGVFELPIFQGEGATIDENEFLGSVKISGGPGAQGKKSSYAVSFSLSRECLLNIDVVDMATAKQVRSELSLTGTGDEMRNRLKPMSVPQVAPARAGAEPEPAKSTKVKGAAAQGAASTDRLDAPGIDRTMAGAEEGFKQPGVLARLASWLKGLFGRE